MTTITLKDGGVQVKLPDGLSEDQLLAFKPFNNWVKGLNNSLSFQAKKESHPFHPDPYQLRGIAVQAFDIFGSGRVGFLKVTAEVTNKAGERLPASVFLRGPSVAMLVMLIPEDAPPGSDERYVVLTVQPRIPAGSLSFVELPAGMVDDSGSFAGAAAKEIQEELGLEIHESKLTCLSELAGAGSSEGNEADEGLAEAMYPSVGGCDEFITIYSHERRIPREQLKDWSGKLTGLRDHGEKITLKLVPMRNLWREGARDAKCLGALALWEGLRREGKL
ncbi:hypothetical protein EsH8_III_001243 [Colletotrichum jinshuiense]